MNKDALEKLRTEGNRRIQAYLAGEEVLAPEDIANAGNPGWFNSSDTIWKVNSDPALLVGGLASLLIQTLHPQVMAGVADHSNYESDPLGRFRRTGRFVGATTFGTEAIAQQSVDLVNAIHKHIVGKTPDGTPYDATDPHLLGWVHVTEIYCFWKSFDAFGPKDHGLNADEYVKQSTKTALALGYQDAPTTWVELEQTLDSYRPECNYGKQASQAVKFLLAPSVVPLAFKPAYLGVSAAALSLLPRWAIEMLMLPVPPVVTPLVIKPAASKLAELLRWFAIDPSQRSLS